MNQLKRWLPVAFLFAVVLSVAYAASFTGWIVDQKCATAGNYKGEHAKHVTADNPIVLLNESDKKVYMLKDPSRAETLIGKKVTVEGTVDGSTIVVERLMEVPERSGQ
jgi:Protein of unknown function (DUF5818)